MPHPDLLKHLSDAELEALKILDDHDMHEEADRLKHKLLNEVKGRGGLAKE